MLATGLMSIPRQLLGLHLQDREFCFCLHYWLGLPMFEVNVSRPVCHLEADRYGNRQVGCGGYPDRIHRHNSVRDAVFSAALAPRREVPSLIPGTQSRLFLPNWSRGRPAALDVTMVSPLLFRGPPCPRAMLYLLESSPMVLNADRLESLSFPLPLRPWVV